MDGIIATNIQKNEQQLTYGLMMVDRFVNRTYLADLTAHEVITLPMDERKTNNIRLFLVEKIVFDDTENSNDKLISVYSAIQNVGASMLLLIQGTPSGVKYYIGVADSANVTISERTLVKSFKANFPGSTLEKKTNSDIERILDQATFDGDDCNVSSVTVVPSMRDEDKEKFVQGIEKFIDAMRGETYSALFISRPIDKSELENRKHGLEQLYSVLSPFAKSTITYGENESLAVSQGVFENFSHTINKSVATTLGTNSSINVSNTTGSNWGVGGGFNYGSNKSNTTGTSTGTSVSKSKTSGTADTTGSGTNKTNTTTTGATKTLTIESTNKTVDVVLKNLDEQLDRIKACEAFGLWESAAYFISDEIQVSIVAANTFKALVSGDNSNVENAYVNIWNQHNSATRAVVEYMRYCKHPSIRIDGIAEFDGNTVTPANYVSGKEIPLLMGLPQKSVNGVSVTIMAEFSRNVFIKDAGMQYIPEKKLPLGCVHHMGVDDAGNTVHLDINSFTSHCFVTGSTGSGKSNTTYCLLQNFLRNNIPFLVIEPAKGEYKNDFGGVEGINIYTTNQYMGAMLKLNPFKFNANIHVLEHLDRLIEIFNACWEMYAAMPAILKSAIEKAYLNKGWDLTNSIFTKVGTPQYPTFSDILTILPQIIKSTSYSADSQGDYIGALVTRVESLTNGITGQIFCDSYSIDDDVLFDQNTIIDLSRVGSTETKSLIMGILVLQLTEYRMANADGSNKQLRHITVLEEAHNLLKNVDQGQSQSSANLLGKSVEMICNSIAEMRTYGEGFIIVDQSPTFVDIAAIKNTNTKIVMRLPENQDCKVVGSSIGLKDNQIAELSKLPVGVAVVMQNNWLEAVLCKVNRASDKFHKETEYCDFKQLKELRSVVIRLLLQQFSAGKLDLAEMIKAINAVNAPIYAKKEMENRVKHICKTFFASHKNKSRFYSSMLSLIGAEGAFRIYEPMIRGKESEVETIKLWREKMIEQLALLLSFNQRKNYDYLMERLLMVMADGANHSTVRYDLILNSYSEAK